MSVKWQMDSFDVYTITAEMQELVEGRVGKVYQNDDEIIIQIQKNGKHDIFIKKGRWMFITSQREEHKEHPPPFAMTLRKYISNGKIISIEQHEFDKIVTIDVMKKSVFHVIIELFSEGNVILADDAWNIIIPLSRQSWAHREIKAKNRYNFPPQRENPFSLSLESFSRIFGQSNKDVVRTLVMDVNSGGKWGEEVCMLAGIEKEKMAAELKKEEIEKVYNSLQSLLTKFRQKEFSPVIIKEEEKDVTVLPFPLSIYEGKKEKFPRFSNALQEFFTQNEKEERIEEEEREKLARQIQQQKDAIARFKEEGDKSKEEGDIIYAHYALCEELLEKGKKGELKEGGTIKKISWPFVTISLPHEKKVRDVRLNVTKNVAQNADEKYELSKKMREKVKGAEKALKETLKKMSEVPTKKEKKQIRKRERKFWFEKYRWFISSDGNIVIAGKDASSNEEVVKKYLKARERYVHADIHGAPSCIVKAQDVDGNFVEISEGTLHEACQFALSYSKAWGHYRSGDVYWVHPEQVSKTPEAGEYLPKGAFVVRGKRNYIQCDIEIGIGKVVVKGEEKIMGGPPSAIKKWASQWIIFIPGEKRKDAVANEFAQQFSVPVEKIQRTIPSGKVSIKERK